MTPELRTERLLIRWGILSTRSDMLGANGRMDDKRCVINAAFTLFFLLMVSKHACQSARLLPSYLHSIGPVADILLACIAIGTASGTANRIVLQHLESEHRMTYVTDLLAQLRHKDSMDQRLARCLLCATRSLGVSFSIATAIVALVSLSRSEKLASWSSLITLADWGADAALFLTGFPSLIAPGILIAASSYDLVHQIEEIERQLRSHSQDPREIDALVPTFESLADLICQRNRSARLQLLIVTLTFLPLIALLVAVPAIPFNPLFKGVLMTPVAAFLLLHLLIYAKPASVATRVSALLPLMHGLQVREVGRLTLAGKRRLLQAIEHASQETQPITFTIASLTPFSRAFLAHLISESITLSFLVVQQYSY